jgi:hypothetical protein
MIWWESELTVFDSLSHKGNHQAPILIPYGSSKYLITSAFRDMFEAPSKADLYRIYVGYALSAQSV